MYPRVSKVMEILDKGHFKKAGSGFLGARPTFAVGVEEQLAAQKNKVMPEVGTPRRQTNNEEASIEATATVQTWEPAAL